MYRSQGGKCIYQRFPDTAPVSHHTHNEVVTALAKQAGPDLLLKALFSCSNLSKLYETIAEPTIALCNCVTESTIIATIHCPDVGYCLFGISLVTHISYYVSCTFPIVIVSHSVVLSFARLFTPLGPCTQLEYSTLPTMY